MSKNFQAYLKLDKSKFINKYVIIIDEKVVQTGTDIRTMFKKVRRKYPKKVPFIAKVPEPGLLVLIKLW